VARVTVVTIWSDLGCPWARLAVERLWRARERLGADVALDHRVFALEVVNARPTPKPALDAETAVIGELLPEAGWSPWRGRDWEYPVTTLPAMEAVQAAKEQGLAASEQLDRALRAALFRESRCVSMRHVILDVAGGCDLVDPDALATALDDGRARSAVMAAAPEGVRGSPHLFRDGRDWHNPGIRMRWDGHRPLVDADDPSVYESIVRP